MYFRLKYNIKSFQLYNNNKTTAAAAAAATGTAAAGTAQTQTHKQTNDEIFEVYSKEDVRRLKKKIKCSIIQRKEGQSRLEVSS